MATAIWYDCRIFKQLFSIWIFSISKSNSFKRQGNNMWKIKSVCTLWLSCGVDKRTFYFAWQIWRLCISFSKTIIISSLTLHEGKAWKYNYLRYLWQLLFIWFSLKDCLWNVDTRYLLLDTQKAEYIAKNLSKKRICQVDVNV